MIRARRPGSETGQGSRGRRAGFALLELTLVIGIVLFAILVMSSSLVASMKLTDSNREAASATNGMREMLETLQGVVEFSDLFAMYNADPDDDPPGVDCPGNGFAVQGLAPVAGDPDGLVGELVFPTVGLELREDVVDAGFGMPRDLNGDGQVDAQNRAGDYRLLPVLLRMRWQGRGGETTLEVRTLVADR